MPTSELLDALNPHVAQARNRIQHVEYSTPPQQPVPPPSPQPYVRHRSELELAISEPVPPPQPPPTRQSTLATKSRGPVSSEGLHAIQELLRVVYNTREAHENERKRRLEWEKEQEEKHEQKHALLERQISEMNHELLTLRSMVSSTHPMALNMSTPPYAITAAPQITGLPTPSSSQPSSASNQPPSYMITPSSSDMLSYEGPSHDYLQQDYDAPSDQPFVDIGQPPSLQPNSLTPAPSPQLANPASVSNGTTTPSGETSRPQKRKRRSESVSSSGNEGSQSEASTSTSRPKRFNHHDKGVYTVHHAMRKHILRLMHLMNDRELPPSHTQNTPISQEDPIRFVWDKTTQQSAHNGRMKTRILEDLKKNRSLYKQVPKSEFGKKTLEAAFESSYSNLRMKFKQQNDDVLSAKNKQRENHKARKARHLSRRKIKLGNRAEARRSLPEYEHLTFDGALQLECMSSEESDVEYPDETSLHPGQPSQPRQVLRTRGYLWRSTRLLQFYCTLDNEERVSKSTKPKRGVGKMERSIGPPKEGTHLPPNGVATWMISRRWLHSAHEAYPDLQEVLKKRVVDPPGFDWDEFDALGSASEISDDEPELEQHQQLDQHQQQQQIPLHIDNSALHTMQQHPTPYLYNASSSSLTNALL